MVELVGTNAKVVRRWKREVVNSQAKQNSSPVAQCHKGEEYEYSANTGDQDDHHDDSVAVRLFDCDRSRYQQQR